MSSDAEDEAQKHAEVCAVAAESFRPEAAQVFKRRWKLGTELVGEYRFFKMVNQELWLRTYCTRRRK